jgi:hypothetical protein
MQLTFHNDDCAVFDEFLPTEQMAAIFAFLRQADFRQVHEARETLEQDLQQGYKRVWRHDEGEALVGPSYAALAWAGDPVPEVLMDLAGRWTRRHQMTFYRSGTPMDFFLGQIKQMAAGQLQRWAGKANDEWVAMTATPYLHPPGVGMSWHADAKLYTGAFSYFIHPEWQADFGGELLVADGMSKDMGEAWWDNRAADPISHRFPDLRQEHQAHGASGGRFFAPVPNRLVILRRGVLHKVNRVSSLAGSRVRAAISGFFVDMQAQGDGRE